MRYHVVLRYIGVVMLLNAAFMLLSALISAAGGVDSGFNALLLSAVLTAAPGAFPMLFVGKTGDIKLKEGYMIVVGAWVVSCVTGTFPYLLWGGEFDVASAWFESVSGFTTTGSTTLNDIEALPRGLLFWRSCTHWLGGVGVVMFTLIMVPALGRMKMTLSSAELSTLARDNYNYKSQKVIRIMLLVYVGLTAAEALLLGLAGMGWFDAVNHAFSTVATGGFSTRNLSIGYYDSTVIEAIVMVFMILSGIHFGVIYATIAGKPNNIFRSEATKYYLGTFLVCGALIAASLWQADIYSAPGESLRHGYFQAASVITTTGFATADTSTWTPLAIILLIFLMFQCGCAGSTSGGIKSDRVWLALKTLRVRMYQQQHPNAVIRLKVNKVAQDEYVVSLALLFIVVYLLLVLLGTIIVAATGLDLMTSFSMVAACMGNVGPGFGEVGTMANFSDISPFVKSVCTLLMLLGRLEIFGFIQLFMLKWWK